MYLQVSEFDFVRPSCVCATLRGMRFAIYSNCLRARFEIFRGKLRLYILNSVTVYVQLIVDDICMNKCAFKRVCS